MATGVVCLALFTVGLHRTLGWFYGEIQKAGGTPAEGRKAWSVRWTASLVALIVLMFVVGISATGVVHQAGWLIASRRSLVEERRHYQYGWGSSVDHLKQIGMGSVMLDHGPGAAPGGRPTERGGASKLDDGHPAAARTSSSAAGCGEDLPWNDPRELGLLQGGGPDLPEPGGRGRPQPRGLRPGPLRRQRPRPGPGPGVARVGPGEASNTILAGEVAEGFKPWGDPTNLRDPGLGVNRVAGGFGGPSGSGANFLFVDGSVRFFQDTTSRDVLRRLSGPRPAGR